MLRIQVLQTQLNGDSSPGLFFGPFPGGDPHLNCLGDADLLELSKLLCQQPCDEEGLLYVDAETPENDEVELLELGCCLIDVVFCCFLAHVDGVVELFPIIHQLQFYLIVSVSVDLSPGFFHRLLFCPVLLYKLLLLDISYFFLLSLRWFFCPAIAFFLCFVLFGVLSCFRFTISLLGCRLAIVSFCFGLIIPVFCSLLFVMQGGFSLPIVFYELGLLLLGLSVSGETGLVFVGGIVGEGVVMLRFGCLFCVEDGFDGFGVVYFYVLGVFFFLLLVIVQFLCESAHGNIQISTKL